jgi:outer membrane protein TolC
MKGKIRSSGLLILLVGLLSAHAFAQETRELRLADAVHEALARNPIVTDARDDVQRSQTAMRLAQSAFTPNVTPNVLGSFGQSSLNNQTYGIGFSERTLWGTEFHGNLGATSAQNQLGTFFSGDTSFVVTQPLLRGWGRQAVSHELEIAKLHVDDSNVQRKLVEQQIAIDVAAAYYHLAAQIQLVDVSEKALERAHGVLDASRAKLAVGRVSRLDVLRAQQLVSQADLQIFDVHTGIDDAKDQLRSLMGRGDESDFSVSTTIPTSTDDLNIKDGAALANRRFDVQLALDAVRQAELSQAFTIDQNLPQVDVSLAVTRQEVGDTFASAIGWDRFHVATFAGISMPLNRTPQNVARENADLEIVKRRRALADVKLKAERQIRAAFRQRDRLLKAIEQADNAVGFAEEEVELASLRFQRGLSNNFDVVAAETNLMVARVHRFGALADAAVARLQLRAAIGGFDLVQDVQ